MVQATGNLERRMILFHSPLRFRFLEAMNVASVERKAALTDHMTVFDFCYDRNSVMLRSGTGETLISLAVVKYLHCLDGVENRDKVNFLSSRNSV